MSAEGTTISTYLRIRPSKNASNYFSVDELEKSTLVFNLPTNFKSDYVNNSKTRHLFQFTGIIPPTASQDDVFKLVGKAALENALQGFNSTVFACMHLMLIFVHYAL